MILKKTQPMGNKTIKNQSEQKKPHHVPRFIDLRTCPENVCFISRPSPKEGEPEELILKYESYHQDEDYGIHYYLSEPVIILPFYHSKTPPQSPRFQSSPQSPRFQSSPRPHSFTYYDSYFDPKNNIIYLTLKNTKIYEDNEFEKLPATYFNLHLLKL